MREEKESLCEALRKDLHKSFTEVFTTAMRVEAVAGRCVCLVLHVSSSHVGTCRQAYYMETNLVEHEVPRH